MKFNSVGDPAKRDQQRTRKNINYEEISMQYWFFVIGIIIGSLIGYLIAYILAKRKAKTAQELAEELFERNESRLKESFGNLSFEALKKSLEMQRDQGVSELDTKKELIDRQLVNMSAELEKVSTLMKDLEKDRAEKFGQLSEHLKLASEQTSELRQTTNTLREALVSSKTRGQWGERMAEDVLRLAGFIEGVNYLKQKSIDEVGTIPDFTFLLPNGLRVNMDVKFPFDNYVKFLDSDSQSEKETYRDKFLKDVKSRVKEITTREYINPEQNTVDYVILFIPNEQIYAFIHEQDYRILDDAIRNKVVFCSPVTLFAVLAVIRQAVENFALSATSNEILTHLGTFQKQWEKFIEKLEIVGRRIGDAQREYESLITTRVRQLEKPLREIENLKSQQNLQLPPDEKDIESYKVE